VLTAVPNGLNLDSASPGAENQKDSSLSARLSAICECLNLLAALYLS
jgi:hypothetical protein